MNKNLNANDLVKLSEQNGFIQTVYSEFGKAINVSIPISEKDMDTDITELNLSVRAFNGLKRRGVSTVRDLVGIIENGELICVRNLGRLSISQIKTIVLDYCYSQLTDGEKIVFFQKLIDKNK